MGRESRKRAERVRSEQKREKEGMYRKSRMCLSFDPVASSVPS